MAQEAASGNLKTKQFTVVFFLELWERFGYYGLAAVLVLFMIKQLGIPERDSIGIYGAFASLIYAGLALGGWLGDKVLGYQRTMIIGMATMMVGYALLVFAGVSREAVMLSLAFICAGSYLFKTQPSSMIAKMYESEPEKLDSAFTMFYMSINVGSAASMILVPIFMVKFGGLVGFGVCAVGMLLALVNFLMFSKMFRGVDSPAGMKNNRGAKTLGVCVMVLAMVGFLFFMLMHVEICRTVLICVAVLLILYLIFAATRLRGGERLKMFGAIILLLEAFLYFIIYYQMPMGLNVFCDKFVQSNILGVPIASNEIFQSINPVVIMVFSPILAWIYAKLGKNDLSMPGKFAVGMLLCSAAYLILPFGVKEGLAHFNQTGMANQPMTGAGTEALRVVSSKWITLNYLFASIGELFISGLGLSMISKLAPRRMLGFVMGAWFMTTSMGGIGASVLGGMTAPSEGATQTIAQSLTGYYHVFFGIGIAALVVGLIMVATVKTMKKLTEA